MGTIMMAVKFRCIGRVGRDRSRKLARRVRATKGAQRCSDGELADWTRVAIFLPAAFRRIEENCRRVADGSRA